MIDIGPNRFKQAFAEQRAQIGFWATLGTATVADLLADCGFNWLLLDCEHSPTDVGEILPQLMTVDRSLMTTPIVRPPWNDMVIFKKLLDIGVRSLLVPMSSAEEARRAVAATRYPPDGIRGVAGGIRANRHGRITDYPGGASDDICLLVQVKTRTGLDNIEDIALVDGVDGVFIGPADLGAAPGHLTDRNHPDVIAAIRDGHRRIVDTGKAAGILTTDVEQAQMWLDEGFIFVACGVDANILAREADALARRFRG